MYLHSGSWELRGRAPAQRFDSVGIVGGLRCKGTASQASGASSRLLGRHFGGTSAALRQLMPQALKPDKPISCISGPALRRHFGGTSSINAGDGNR